MSKSNKPTRFGENYFQSFQEAGAARTASQAMSMDGSKRDRSIPRRPLLWLVAALLFTLPPMFGSLVSWVPSVFLVALAMKFWMEPRGYRLRFATLKLLLATAALFAIFAQLWFSERRRAGDISPCCSRRSQSSGGAHGA